MLGTSINIESLSKLFFKDFAKTKNYVSLQLKNLGKDTFKEHLSVATFNKNIANIFNIDVQSHVLNPLITEKLLLHSHGIRSKVKPVRDETKKFEKRQDSSHSFLNFIQVLKRLLRLKRLMRIYISKYVNFHATFNLIFKFIDFENSMKMAAAHRRRELSILIRLLSCSKILRHCK